MPSKISHFSGKTAESHIDSCNASRCNVWPYSFINIDGSEDPGRRKRNIAELTVIMESLHNLRKGAIVFVPF
jgi:hypothetical protein